ncbi:MAG: hypothetical protein AAF936_18420 [Pseudomonadota bacterium]
MVWVFLPIVQAPKYDAPSTDAEARLQDIDYLSTLTKYDRAFSETAKSSFSEKLQSMRDKAADMSDVQFYLAIAEAVALADNGHTNVSYRPQYTQFNTIGARLYAFSDGVFVLSTAPDKVDTLGRRVVSVEGASIDDLRLALGKYRGGNETWRTLYSALLIESPDLLGAAGHAASARAIEITLQSPTGETEQVQFEGLSLESTEDVPGRSAWETLTPDAGSPGFTDWPHVLEAEDAATPRYLTNPDEPLFYALDDNGFYIRALPGFSAGDQSIKNAYKSMLAEHPEGSLDYLVVDFRLHDGGDYTKSIAFAKAAPKAVKEDGDIYIITGPNTFSAAIVTVALLKYYSGDRGVIIGEQMGDREQFWAERGSDFRLPNSGYYINYATGYHDWENGCKGEPYCYTMNEIHEVPAGSLAPEIALPQDFESYRRGEDVVMNWVAQQR